MCYYYLGAVAEKIMKYLAEIKALQEANESKENVVEMMKHDVEKMKIELMYQKSRADGLEEINKTFRTTNFDSVQESGETIKWRRVSKKTVPVTKHTPDLLKHTRIGFHC